MRFKRFRLWLHAVRLGWWEFRAPLCLHECTDTMSTLIRWQVYNNGKPVTGMCPNCDVKVTYDPKLKTFRDHLEENGF